MPFDTAHFCSRKLLKRSLECFISHEKSYKITFFMKKTNRAQLSWENMRYLYVLFRCNYAKVMKQWKLIKRLMLLGCILEK